MVPTELVIKQTRDEVQRNRAEELVPSRALYSTVQSTATDSKPNGETPEPPPPIRCDECGKRARAIGTLLYFCPRCRTTTSIYPGKGRVEYSEA